MRTSSASKSSSQSFSPHMENSVRSSPEERRSPDESPLGRLPCMLAVVGAVRVSEPMLEGAFLKGTKLCGACCGGIMESESCCGGSVMFIILAACTATSYSG